MSYMALVLLAGRALLLSGDYARAEQLLTQRPRRISDPGHRSGTATPSCSACSPTCSGCSTAGLQGIETAKRALDSLPAGRRRRAASGPSCWTGCSRRTFLRGRFREASADAQQALAEARRGRRPGQPGRGAQHAGDGGQVMLGDVESGTARLREAIALCERENDLDGVAYALRQPGRHARHRRAHAPRACRPLAMGCSAVPRHVRASHDWMTMTISELAFMTGDWDTARSHLGPPPARAGRRAPHLPSAARGRARPRRGRRGPRRAEALRAMRAAGRAVLRAAVDRQLRRAGGRAPAPPSAI